jgi:hypothetical protein
VSNAVDQVRVGVVFELFRAMGELAPDCIREEFFWLGAECILRVVCLLYMISRVS